MAKTLRGKATINCTITTFDGQKEVSQHIENMEILRMEEIEDMDDWNLRRYIANYILMYGLDGLFP